MIAGGPLPYPMPALSRMMVFADGENIVSRYQAMHKEGFKPRDEVQHERDVYAWHPQAVCPELHHVIRATYYASATGDEQTIWKIDEKIRSLQAAYAQASGPPKCCVQNGNAEVRSLLV